MNSKEELQKAVVWLLQNDSKGESAKEIFRVMTGFGSPQGYVPNDYYDLARCIQLVCIFPEWRPHLHKLCRINPNWQPIVDNWDALVTLAPNGVPQTLYYDTISHWLKSSYQFITLKQMIREKRHNGVSEMAAEQSANEGLAR